MSKIKIMIADDHAVVREGLRNLFEEQPDMEVIAEVSDGMQAVKKVKNVSPDVALIDIAMPNLNGLEAVSLIKEASPDTQVVLLSMHKKDAYVHQALGAGALGYVLKASPTSEVLEAIRSVHKGEYFLSSKINSKIITAFLKSRTEKPSLSGYDLLSEREQQVFRLLVEGKSSVEIADILCISSKTVEKHRANTMKKLDIHNMVSMVKYAIKIGIIGPELWEE
ncbi:Two component system response regulator, LuxR domain-containing [Desulfonema limicola]|uniref:Two component system response regulator, LuxR domain-containing n=1 Tax=Desulfonema limicola TaxID=45656 RepID=A0A975GI05_9BACT|nr:response regulator transcription factor [Desulfonema limicola]QTA82095.1 Two component system response regulator, LuxR domain-containing [Desulfonema limicola]